MERQKENFKFEISAFILPHNLAYINIFPQYFIGHYSDYI